MNLNSITTKISLIFLLAISILIALFILYLDFEHKEQNIQVQNYHDNISKYLKENRMREGEALRYLETLDFKIEDKPFIVIPNSKTIFSKRGFETLKYKEYYYLHIITPHFRLLFKDLTSYQKTHYAYIIFFILFMLLILIYFWLIKSLEPLKQLKENIQEFSKGDLTVNCRSNKKDEIAEVSNEFDNAVKKIELLLNSRQLFLRTIMHELKTPIAKGRIVSELIDDNKQKNRMITIFERLEFLIDDFSKVEQVLSNNYEPIKQNILIVDIINDAINVLMIESDIDKISIDIQENKKINVDLSLMSMVIKNLIDNAFKYSSDEHIKIKNKNDILYFISKGDKLPKPLVDYFKPFHNNTQSKNHGMGLGLYIVKSILDMHGIDFDYEYKNGNNVFKIIYKS